MGSISNKVARSKQVLFLLMWNFVMNVKEQIALYNPITNLIDIYMELDKPVEDEGLKQLMNSRHMQYMKLLWNVNKVTELVSLTLLVIASFFLSWDDSDSFNFKILCLYIICNLSTMLYNLFKYLSTDKAFKNNWDASLKIQYLC